MNGQSALATVLNAFMASPEWKDSVFFLSYDEGGGPYDHVPPVPGHSNDNTDASLGHDSGHRGDCGKPGCYKPCVPSGGTATLHRDLKSTSPGANSGDAAAAQGLGAQLGLRVPNMVISPFVRRHYVSRFVGSSTHLTARDAAQSSLLGFFDFTNVPWATPPTPPAPVTPSSLGYNPCTPASMGQ